MITQINSAAFLQTRLYVFLLFCVCLSFNVVGSEDENLLGADDDFYVGAESLELTDEPTSAVEQSSFPLLALLKRGSRLSVKTDLATSNKLDLSRSRLRFEFENSLWSGAYVRFDHSLTYFQEKDRLAVNNGGSYYYATFDEAWLQISERNCVAKMGKQWLFWGNVEGAYVLDVVTPLDLTKPLITDFSAIRRAQNMVLGNCYNGEHRIEVFYLHDAKLNRYSHENSPYRSLENSLKDEWGVRTQFSAFNLDLSFMYAHLYSNSPSVMVDASTLTPFALSQRYDLYGASAAWFSGSLMLELDAALKTQQLVDDLGQSGQAINTEDQAELALGFEYLTPQNHQLAGGVWTYSTPASGTQPKFSRKVWNLSWSKDFLNDLLNLSLLGAWRSPDDVLSAAVQAQYDYSDLWQFTSALSYSSRASQSDIFLPNAKMSVFLSVELTL